MATGAGSPCGACKFLRRKCAADCVFAPYFCSEEGPAKFAAIHKVFGASNVSKLLLHVPPLHRCDAVAAIAYEAQARVTDPVYGCVAHIFALQQQVVYLEAQLMQAKAQVAENMKKQWVNNNSGAGIGSSSSSSFEDPNYNSIDDAIQSRDEAFQHYYSKKRNSQADLSELQALALRMMNTNNGNN